LIDTNSPLSTVPGAVETGPFREIARSLPLPVLNQEVKGNPCQESKNFRLHSIGDTKPQKRRLQVDCDHLMHQDGGNSKLDITCSLSKRRNGAGDKEPDLFRLLALREPQANPLLTHRNELAKRSLHHHRIRQINEV